MLGNRSENKFRCWVGTTSATIPNEARQVPIRVGKVKVRKALMFILLNMHMQA